MKVWVISQGKSYVARELSMEIGPLGAIAYGGFQEQVRQVSIYQEQYRYGGYCLRKGKGKITPNTIM